MKDDSGRNLRKSIGDSSEGDQPFSTIISKMFDNYSQGGGTGGYT